MTLPNQGRIKRIVLIVLDGCGCGALPDADRYGDAGADTLAHLIRATPGIQLPNLSAWGLGALHPATGLPRAEHPRASYGRMAERSIGKDTATGHWELMGVVTNQPFVTFPEGFPKEMIDAFTEATGRGVLGNCVASGTEIIQALGEEHQRTGRWIVYTSADSVFQVAAHEETIPLEELYRACETAYGIVTPRGVARVIARPFRGEPGAYYRTENRHDYTVPPPSETVMQKVVGAGIEVTGIGKIRDIFAGRGVSRHIRATNNADITRRTIEAVRGGITGLIFANLVDFDMLYGHRRNPEGMGRALEAFDAALPDLEAVLSPGDLAIVTADHGNDPTWHGTDHCREYVPLLVYVPGKEGRRLGTRSTFADVGATIADAFGVPGTGVGTSFLEEVAS